MLRRIFSIAQHVQRSLEWNVEHASLARGRDFAGRSNLLRSEIRVFTLSQAWLGVFELQAAPGKVTATIAGKIQRQRIIPIDQPNLATNATWLAVIQLTLNYSFCNPPGH